MRGSSPGDEPRSLLKLMLRGTYVAVEPFHLDAYVTEQVFRFNNCGPKMNDGKRFEKVMGNVAGRRLTYAELTGTGSATSLFSRRRQGRGKRKR